MSRKPDVTLPPGLIPFGSEFVTLPVQDVTLRLKVAPFSLPPVETDVTLRSKNVPFPGLPWRPMSPFRPDLSPIWPEKCLPRVLDVTLRAQVSSLASPMPSLEAPKRSVR